MRFIDISKRLWTAPNGHVYYGEFSDEYRPHLFDVSEFIEVLYCDSIPGEVTEELNKLVVSYFLEATRHTQPETSKKEMNDIAAPVAWLAGRIQDCLIFDGALIADYQRAMSLPIEPAEDSFARYKAMNGLKE